jgi:hypothetical protein
VPTAPRRTRSTIVKRLSRLLQHGTDEKYTFLPHHRAPALAWIDEAAQGDDAIVAVGGVLKLIRVLRVRHASPSAADWLSDLVKASRAALRIVTLHWSSGKRARLGADLLPVKTGRAPRYGAAPAAGTVRAGSFLEPGRDLRSAHIQKRIMRRKS